MIINTALASSLAIAADKAIAEEGDDVTRVPSVILPTDKILAPHHILVAASGKVASSSFITHFEKLRAASTGATADVIVTLTRGLWTINWNMHVDCQTGGSANGPAAVKLLVQMESDTMNFCGMFRSSTPMFPSGRFRLLLGANADIRLDIVATAAGDAIDAHVTLNVEKNIG